MFLSSLSHSFIHSLAGIARNFTDSSQIQDEMLMGSKVGWRYGLEDKELAVE